MGPGCELSTGLVASIGAGAFGVLCVSCIVRALIGLWGLGGVKAENVKAVASLETPRALASAATLRSNHHHDVISFKDDGPQEIRIKLL
jgi:hypothetical protein